MPDKGSLRTASQRRSLAPVALLVTVAATLLIIVPTPASARPGAASSATTTTRLKHPAVSASRLGGAGGAVTVSAATVNTMHCRLHVRPVLRRTPPTKTCTGKAVRWSVRLPANPTVHAVRYRFTITAVGAHHHRAAARHRTVTVAATSAPPSITSFAASTSSLEYVGGQTDVVLSATNNLRCALSVTPVVPVPPSAACTRHTTKWSLAFPANTTNTAITYTVGVTVTGTQQQQATATTTVAVAPQPPPCPGQTSTATPTTAAFFNDPTTHLPADQTRVVDAEVNLICAAQLPIKGQPTQIALAMYIYQLDRVSQALLWAQTYMHASVHVLLDGSSKFEYAPDGTVVENSAYDSLVAGLPPGSVVLCGPNAGVAPPPHTDTGDDSGGVFPAGTGCAGDNIMHAKLLTISAVDAAGDPAVFTSSQNLGARAETAALNNALQIVGDDAAYQQDVKYLALLGQDKPQADIGDAIGSPPINVGGATLNDNYFPRNASGAFPTSTKADRASDRATDPIAALLKSVDCKNPGSQAGNADHTRTTIKIAVAGFKSRPVVTTALTSLAHAGCDIQVIYSEMPQKTLAPLQAAGITPQMINDNAYPYGDGSGVGLIFLHDKYLLISGGIKSDGHTLTDQDIVVTGSANLTQRSLHRDDNAAVIYRQTAGSTPIFDAYTADWAHLEAILATIASPPTL